MKSMDRAAASRAGRKVSSTGASICWRKWHASRSALQILDTGTTDQEGTPKRIPWPPDADRLGDMMTDTNLRLQGAILHVRDLAQTIAYYTGLLDLEVVRQTSNAAVLASQAGISTIALRERRSAQQITDRTVEALVWRLPSLGALSQVEERARRLDAQAVKRTIQGEAFTLLSVWDPDGQRLVFIHHDGLADVPQDVPAEVFWY